MNNPEFDTALFAAASDAEKKTESIVRPSVGYWRDVWTRLSRNRVSFAALMIIVAIMLCAIIIPEVSVDKYNTGELQISNNSPNARHWFGTDNIGRDVFVRVFYGARYSILIGLVAALINLVIGVLYGSVSAFFGGRADIIMMRIVDVLYSIPLTIYVIILMTFLNRPGAEGSEIGTMIIAFSISYWISMARIVRGEILQLKQQEFVLAAKALGASDWRVLIKHLIPNCLGSITVTTMMLVPQAIFLEAFLSFIGLGLSAPRASLGTLCNDALAGLNQYPYQMFFPALMISVIILAFNLFGDGLRDALDPKMKD
ncbi:MAG: ABC transporter permease [Clostridiales bacterium]|jgi:oligopeptide transport system permease protein|nr:ABC transporter permease [Clostridiales bacterium]